MTTDIRPQWIAVDWGAEVQRAYAMGKGGQVLARAESRHDSLADIESHLLDLIGPWLSDTPLPVLASGHIGAGGAFAVTPGAVPCKPAEAKPQRQPTCDARIALHILPGVQQSRPADLMQGGETQVAGILAQHPQFDGVLCLTGAQSRWIHISAEEIVSFQSALTGELRALLSDHSSLQSALKGDGPLDFDAFDAALSETLSRPERLAQALAGLQAITDPAQARGRLSGLLIGAELAAMRPYWLGQQVLLAGPQDLSALYARALQTQGVPSASNDAEFLTLAGLCLAWKTLQAG
ncbi:2-dehydro-3-deoxygalactonokinase [Pararhodobacter oceanensis]|uniref:2-keto-3-deoxy-galactonokinase n=1 Tax=Pararhodobacter oceanensis TaxID=2172121 RepID=A0A2T8HSQ8_9RHOB|nr:2-dehydro-3-deoxygalactonokinase [Pararhodobacter oceanensis]PVH28423.1 2-keto-3-deoxy-galactonokinase [Pararhodobacter oceanensis]